MRASTAGDKLLMARALYGDWLTVPVFERMSGTRLGVVPIMEVQRIKQSNAVP